MPKPMADKPQERYGQACDLAGKPGHDIEDQCDEYQGQRHIHEERGTPRQMFSEQSGYQRPTKGSHRPNDSLRAENFGNKPRREKFGNKCVANRGDDALAKSLKRTSDQYLGHRRSERCDKRAREKHQRGPHQRHPRAYSGLQQCATGAADNGEDEIEGESPGNQLESANFAHCRRKRCGNQETIEGEQRYTKA